MIRYRCPKCRQLLTAHEDDAGTKLSCPYCGQRVQVPSPSKKTMLGKLEEPPGEADDGGGERKTAPASSPPRYMADPPPVRAKPQPPPAEHRPEAPAADASSGGDYEGQPQPPEYDSAPYAPPYRRKPGKVQAIAIMILVGGIIACTKVVLLDVFLALHTLGLFCVPGVYSLVFGVRSRADVAESPAPGYVS